MVATTEPSGDAAAWLTGPRCPRNTSVSTPRPRSHTRAVPSNDAETTLSPAKASPLTRSWCPAITVTRPNVSPSRTVRSFHSPATRRPSGANASAPTVRLSARASTPVGSPVTASHTRIVPSSVPPVTMRSPSGENVTARTKPVCPTSRVILPVRRSHTGGSRTVSEPAASLVPSGLKAMVVSFSVVPTRVITSSPVAELHTVTPVGSAGAAKVLPSGLNVTPAYICRTPGTVSQSRAPRTLMSQRRVVPSALVVSTCSSSGMNSASVRIPPPCPTSRSSIWPVRARQMVATESVPAVRTSSPSGLNVTSSNGVPAVMVLRSFPVRALRMTTWASYAALASQRPSGL